VRHVPMRVALVACSVALAGCDSPHLEARGIEGHNMAAANPTVVEALTAYYPAPAIPISEFVEVAGYHDAQRFQRNAAARDYGPLVAVYTGPTRRTISDFEAPTGAVVGVVEVYGNSHSIQSYKRLGLSQRTSATQLYCIWLHHATSPQVKWEAAMRLYSVDDLCDPPQPNSFPLDVTEGADVASSEADIPVGIRIVDDDDDFPAIGVVCLMRVCEIGTKKFRSPKTQKANAQGRIKSWHDEQDLGEQTTGPLGRSATIASITPTPGIKDLDISAWEATNGVLAATIVVSGSAVPAKYMNWHLESGHSTSLYIRKSGVGWGAQFVLDNGPSVPTDPWIPIARNAHSFKPEGMARWVWDENDEGAWVACEQGCCEISQDPPVSLFGRGRGRGGMLKPASGPGGRGPRP
jgi:hypothetical protein